MTPRQRRRGNWSVQELERLRELLPRRGVADTASLLRRSPDSVRRKAMELFAGRPRPEDVWSGDEDLALRRSWGAVEPRLLAVMLQRSLSSILRRAADLRAAPRQGAWSRVELRLLKEFYGTRTDEDLEVCLVRQRAEIQAMAQRLCLNKDKRFQKERARSAAPARRRMPRWSAEEVGQLRSLYADRDNLEVARALGRSVASVANKANQLGLKKSPGLLTRIGRTNVRLRYGDDGQPES